MDQQLKQRLIGVTIVVALVVIFVPMLFDKSDEKGKLSSTGIPSIPEDVLEKPIELPKTAEDLAPKEDEESEKPVAESGYRIVPLNEDIPPKPRAVPDKAAKPTPGDGGDEPVGVLSDEEEGPPETKKPGKGIQQLEKTKPEQGKALKPEKTESVVNRLIEPKQTSAPKKANTPAAKTQSTGEARDVEGEPVPAPAKAEAQQAKPKPSTGSSSRQAFPAPKISDSNKKPDTGKPSQSRQSAVKASKPKPTPPLPETDRDVEEEPVPIPAKEETPQAKPKSSTGISSRQIESAVKKPDTANKPAVSTRSPVNPEKKAPEPAAVNSRQAKPAAATPGAQAGKPAKQKDEGGTPKAQAKTPTTWTIQAGSFTEESSARGLAEKLKQSKFPAYVETIHGTHGSVYKVQVGSEQDRGRAEETLKQIEGSIGINGVITPRH